jgi:lactose/L-arabinose transport system ATP-binding protein
MNFLSATALGGGRFTAAGAEIDLPLATAVEPGTNVKFGIRPEHLEATEGIGLEVAVDVVEQLGSTSFLYGTTASGEPIVAEQRLGHARSDGSVTLRFRPADARLFGGDGARIR